MRVFLTGIAASSSRHRLPKASDRLTTNHLLLGRLPSASPQYAASVADRLADQARECLPAVPGDGSSRAAGVAAQVDLLWRIAGTDIRRTHAIKLAQPLHRKEA